MENTEILDWRKQAKIAMIKKDITMDELAKRVGRTRTYVSAIVNGRIFSAPTNQLISDILDIPYERTVR